MNKLIRFIGWMFYTLVWIGGAALVVSCSSGPGSVNDNNGRGDAPIDTKKINRDAPWVYNMPDSYGNIAKKCVADGVMMYESSENKSGYFLLRDDPTCKVTAQ